MSIIVYFTDTEYNNMASAESAALVAMANRTYTVIACEKYAERRK